jgi:pyruvate kinase
MKFQEKKLRGLIEQIDALIASARIGEEKYAKELSKVDPHFAKSALNLIHYRAVREFDIRDIQKKLGSLGLSRLARAESHILASLLRTKAILETLATGRLVEPVRSGLSIKKGGRLIRSHSKQLLGYRSKGRRVRIMVTLPTGAARSFELVNNLVACGMNTARINCAHDEPDDWLKMIENVRRANIKNRKNCKISMDLAGPKIRTGEIQPGPMVRKFHPEKDSYGKVLEPITVVLVPGGDLPEERLNYLPVSESFIGQLRMGDAIDILDTQGEERKLLVDRIAGNEVFTKCLKTTYVETGSELVLRKNELEIKTQVGELPAIAGKIPLRKGDIIIVHLDPDPGEAARCNHHGKDSIRPAHISCTSREVFQNVKTGEEIQFDDGKIAGEIIDVCGTEMRIKIKFAKSGRAMLKADKGMNFPDSDLEIGGLTQKDKVDLKFVAQHADVINMSFVNNKEDVEMLQAEINKYDSRDRLGVVFKIETRRGFNNLTEILLTAMRMHPIGIMIARGDLAVEVGWKNIAWIQEEILSICQAGHVPDIWATQVLETLAKKGMPSRAEITDAAMAQRAECVMLNKGPYILNAIKLLDTILKEMFQHQDKEATMTPVLEKAH